jgi:hypothetical protein
MDLLLTSIIGVVCTGLSSLITWLFTRRKYNTEVEHNNIENMEGSLEFYEKLTASSNKILAEVLEKSEKLAQSNVELLIEVQNLRAQIGILTEVLKNEVDNLDFEKYGIKISEDGTLVRIH